MEAQKQAVQELERYVLGALRELQRAANRPDLKCRELSLAVTHVEEATHWLDALYTRLLSEPVFGPPVGGPPAVPKSPAG